MESTQQEARKDWSRSDLNEHSDRAKQARDSGAPAAPCGDSSSPSFGAIEPSGALPGISTRAATAAVLTTLGLRLSQELVQTLQEALPPAYSGLLAADPDLRAEPGAAFGRQDLIEHIARQLGLPEDAAEAVARTVLLSLRNQLPMQKAAALESRLPRDLVNLWRTRQTRERVHTCIASAAGGWSRPGSPYSI
jgi:uncharacterized protein (DUF2267 family)